MTETNLTLEEWLDDLCVRFIINLPEDDLKDVPRICFQVEEAQWFYEDFIRPLDPSLPSMSLRSFCLRIFAHCPLLSPFSQGHHMAAFEDFLAYKTRVPVRGAIMLNEAMDSVVLVKGWKKGASWSFPRGKIAKDEDDLTCAIREVYEETGLELGAAGLVPEGRDVKSIEVNMREQQMRLFVFRGVPMDTKFAPRTRKEISKIEWWRLSELPAFRKKGQQQHADTGMSASKFYMVAPFLVPLRKWVIEQKKKDAKRATSNQYLSAGMSHDDLLTEEDQGAESAAQASAYESRAAPELNTIEGTEAALNRLLKIQPPTQGLQPDAAIAPVTATNSGSALLALLHSKPVTTSQPIPANAPPRTPLEHIDVNPSMPKTPHRHQPRPPAFSSMPPPPQFPIQRRDDSFSYHEPTSQNEHHVNHLRIQQAHRGGHQNSQRNQNNMHHYQPQHLIHPQPLPPNVQRAVFTGGPVHSPMVPQPIQQHHQHQPPQHANMKNPQFPNVHAPMVPPQNHDQGTKLTSHSLALLNAFKSRDTSNETSKAELPLRRFTEAPAAQRAQPQELPAVEARRTTSFGIPPPIVLKQNVGILDPGALTPRQPISESQKSALLGIFKSPSSQAASLAITLKATALPTNGTPSAVELSAVEPLSTNATTTSALLNDKRAPDHIISSGSVPLLNPESNLPFRAMSILSRPVGEKHEISPKNKPEVSPLPRSYTEQITPREHDRYQPSPQPLGNFQPQILKRPSSNALTTPRQVQSSARSSTFIPTIQKHEPTEGSSDHKQTLLSLFGKAQLSPNPLGGETSIGSRKEPILNPAPRLRVGSLANEGARRGSQTPISSADKGFLLSYLDAVTNGSQL
ncbi:hypothetical protein HYALB_00011145 [Hymenoscyphus albidus]|uniref:Nudix hydrolase domain-containing protein n=1 Tax=Hymenoscyphus albidus TaxID=595503 RepID=A0A9N9Q5T2_9HELO|nr:hypothetical protein HYALB_00011145 [Hymenoscyphus albidus]